MPEKFTPSPGKLVKFVDEDGIVRGGHLNRKERRRLGIRGKKEKTA